MHNCPYCGSENVILKGSRSSKSGKKQRLKCKDCHQWHSIKLYDKSDYTVKLIAPTINFEDQFPEYDGMVITSCLNDTPTNKKFLESLIRYCTDKNFKLFIIPIKYLNPSAYNADKGASWSPLVTNYLLHSTIKWKNKFKVIGDCNIQATASHPLTSIDRLSEGITTIVGHPVLQMKTLPVNNWKEPVILHSTGCISEKTFYSSTKAGYQASFHHCFGALVVEFDNDRFHLRQLLADSTGGFADLDQYWNSKGSTKTEIDALICGDEHVIFGDKEAYAGTFYNKDSIVKTLKPKYIIRHDVLDSHSISKHHENDFFTRYRKNIQTKTASIEDELNLTLKHLEDSTPSGSISLIVNSNHHDHLDQWLNNQSVKHDYVNAELFHYLMWKKLLAIKHSHKERPALQIFMEDVYAMDPNKVRFMEDGFSLHGILLSIHGDRGPSGVRGALQNLSKIGDRTVIGHSHCFVDGHSALTKTGWKSIHEVQEGELVLAYDHSTNSNVWVENKKTHVMDYTGDVIKIRTEHFRQTVTTNHNLFLKNGEYKNVCETILTKSPNVIPICSNGVVDLGGDDKGLTEKQVRQIVAFCADGTIDKKSKAIRFHLKKQRKIDRLSEMFSDSFTPMSGIKTSKTGSKRFLISNSTETYNFLYNSVNGEKRLPEFFRNFSTKMKEVVLDELKYWDGTFDTGSNARQWTTTKPEEADLISSLLVELGYRTSSYKKWGGGKPSNPNAKDTLCVTWNNDKNKNDWHSTEDHQKNLQRMWGIQVEFVENARVSCLTTDKMNFWVKHDSSGKVSLTGNSPGILAGAFQVGTLSEIDLDYTKGSPTGWIHTNCIIHKNGKRQLINVIGGKWRK